MHGGVKGKGKAATAETPKAQRTAAQSLQDDAPLPLHFPAGHGNSPVPAWQYFPALQLTWLHEGEQQPLAHFLPMVKHVKSAQPSTAKKNKNSEQIMRRAQTPI